MPVGELVLGVVGTVVVLGVLVAVLADQWQSSRTRASRSNPRP